jgi:hypothetical protein
MVWEAIADNSAHLVAYGPAFMLTGLPIAKGVEAFLDILMSSKSSSSPDDEEEDEKSKEQQELEEAEEALEEKRLALRKRRRELEAGGE